MWGAPAAAAIIVRHETEWRYRSFFEAAGALQGGVVMVLVVWMPHGLAVWGIEVMVWHVNNSIWYSVMGELSSNEVRLGLEWQIEESI